MDKKSQKIAVFCCRPFRVKLVKIMVAEPKMFPLGPIEYEVTTGITLTGCKEDGQPEWSNLLELERNLPEMPYDFFFLYAEGRLLFTVIDAESRAKGIWGAVWYTFEEARNLSPADLLALSILRRIGASPDGLDPFRYPERHFKECGQ